MAGTDRGDTAVGKSLTGDAAPPAAPPASARAGTPEPAIGFTTDPTRPVPAAVATIVADLRVPAGSKTAGVLATADGSRLHDAPLVNGSAGALLDNRQDLKPPWRLMDVAIAHVEGHAAAIMRQRKLTHATLVVSERPCPGRMGCHAMLAHLLDRGATLDVYVAGRQGPLYWGTYTGTGEGTATP